MKMPSGQKLLAEISPDFEEFPRKRGSEKEDAVGIGAAQKKAREDRTSVGAERASTSYGEPSHGKQRHAGEELSRGAEEGETRKDLFSGKERPPASSQQQQEERQQLPAFDAEAAAKKLAQTKEHFAELCRNYLASYKTQGADVIYQLASARFTATRPEEEATVRERNAAGGTTASVSAPRRPPSNKQTPPPEYLVLSDSDPERNDEGTAARHRSSSAVCPPSNNYQPPPECRRLPSDFDGFLKSDVLQLEYHPSNASYREELLSLESRTIKMLDSFHQNEVESETGGHECDETILCTARANESDTSAISQFRSYQLAFRAAAVAEIVRLKSNLIKSKMEVAGLLCDETLGKAFSGGRPEFELIKRLKLENESAASELAQLRAEKKVSDESFGEIQGAMEYLQKQISSCTCKHVFPGKKIGRTTREAPLELIAGVDGVQQQRQQNGHDIASRVKPIRAYHPGVSVDDELALERICEASVEEDVFKLIEKRLEAIKADMGVFVKTLQSRVASVAGKINESVGRVRPVKVGLFCLTLLIKKLEAKKAEIEASLVENSSDNRLQLKLHFRS